MKTPQFGLHIFSTYFYGIKKLNVMRLPWFIPMILLDLFCVMTLISSFVVGPTWKFYLSLVGVIAFTIGSILTGGYLIRQGDSANHH